MKIVSILNIFGATIHISFSLQKDDDKKHTQRTWTHFWPIKRQIFDQVWTLQHICIYIYINICCRVPGWDPRAPLRSAWDGRISPCSLKIVFSKSFLQGEWDLKKANPAKSLWIKCLIEYLCCTTKRPPPCTKARPSHALSLRQFCRFQGHLGGPSKPSKPLVL